MKYFAFKKGDTVMLVSGKDKGKKGKVLDVMPKDGKVVIEGLNLLVKNVRPKRQGEKGQVVKYNAPLNASNVLLFCSTCGRGRRIGYQLQKDGKKVRICKKCKHIFS
ncbi:MAG: 50S ribosomal protein L24 [Parcubacteria group bacterium]